MPTEVRRGRKIAIEWYVVPNPLAHTGAATTPQALESAVTALRIGFDSGTENDVTHALGYSYSDDPNFMYCAEPMGVETQGVNWWLPSCDPSGGATPPGPVWPVRSSAAPPRSAPSTRRTEHRSYRYRTLRDVVTTTC